MLKQIKNGGTVVIDKSHKSLYRTPISCMEYFNSFSLTVLALVFFTSYYFSLGLSDREFWRCISGIWA